jgi:hypothetical protein
MMRYTDEVNQNIRNQIGNVKRKILLTNIKAKAFKGLNNTDEKAEAVPNFNDIEVDEFKRRALFNDYARKLLGYGDISKFQKRVEDSNYVNFFLNNYPKIEKELKMYSVPSADNLFTVIKKLFNQEMNQIKMLSNRQNDEDNIFDVKSLLNTLSQNLVDLRDFADTEQQRNDLKDKQNKVDALIELMKVIRDDVVFLQDVFKLSHADLINQMNQSITNTTVPADPSIPVPIQATTIFDTISRGTFKEAYEKSIAALNSKSSTPVKSQNQSSTPNQSPTSMLKQGTPYQTPNQTPNQSPTSSIKKQITPYNTNLQQLQIQFNNDITDESLPSELEAMVRDNRFSERFYAKHLAHLMQPIGLTENDFSIKGDKYDMFNYFIELLPRVVQKLEDEKVKKKSRESLIQEETNRQEEREKKLIRAKLNEKTLIKKDMDEKIILMRQMDWGEFSRTYTNLRISYNIGEHVNSKTDKIAQLNEFMSQNEKEMRRLRLALRKK